MKENMLWKGMAAVTLTLAMGIPASALAQAHQQHPASTPATNANPVDELAALRARVAELERALQQAQAGTNPQAGMSAGMGKGGVGMGGMGTGMAMGMQQKPGSMGGGGMEGMDMMQMGGMGSPPPGAMGMEGMDQMGKGGMGAAGAMAPPTSTMGMEPMDAMEMGGMAAPGAMESPDMPGMQAMGMVPSQMTTSALPGFPGVSHLYHVGATGFFLDHAQHVSLTAEQSQQLGKLREQALSDSATAQRRVEQAEQELWQLTAADAPDAGRIEAKVREIEKLRADERLSFIRKVGEAARLLTPDQRSQVVGTP